jgi:hypothetical protein
MKQTSLSAAPGQMEAPPRAPHGEVEGRTGSQLIWNDRCQARTSYFVDVSPPWGSESTVKAGRFDDESL